ncbi:MAG: LysM peptidoglycan-binding domain-containing protein [Kiritimatiellaceae bacterium]|nr:LysM peptidoglycan-binding domain-containing protein [Kiritimatiellaceae bacterium]
MADLFVRPYDQQRKSPMRLITTALVVIVITILVVAVLIGLERKPSPDSELVPADQAGDVPALAEPMSFSGSSGTSSGSSTGADGSAQQMFARAQSLIAAGNLEQARELLYQVVATATEESMRNNALRVLGRINLQLFISPTPMAEKKSYVIQPGDSLDKIARQNKTTVELIRKMNTIDGNVIYPGRRLLIPANPFVLLVDKSSRTVDLTMGGKLMKRYVVGLGVHGKTPVGNFVTVVHQTNPDWTQPGGGIIPFGDPRNILGTRWMSIQDATRPDIKGFGIHGTPLRDSIGAETSNGCVRMLNEEVEELYLLIPRGTEVIISE